MNRNLLAVAMVVILVACGVSTEAADWETDFAKAAASAGKAKSYLLLDFSGSDWCGWCMRLDGEVFSKSEFKKYAKKNLVCVLVDFPHQKKQSNLQKEQNARLAEKYGINGYPTVIILAPDGELVGRTGYVEGGAKNYVGQLKKMIADYKQDHPGSETGAPQPAGKPAAGAGK